MDLDTVLDYRWWEDVSLVLGVSASLDTDLGVARLRLTVLLHVLWIAFTTRLELKAILEGGVSVILRVSANLDTGLGYSWWDDVSLIIGVSASLDTVLGEDVVSMILGVFVNLGVVLEVDICVTTRLELWVTIGGMASP